MIDFGKPLAGGWQCMLQTLFRPFDFGKWLALGFTAFLASLLTGPFNSSSGSSTRSFDSKDVPVESFGNSANFGLWLEQWPGWSGLAAGIFLLSIAIICLILWLGSRGQFMFLDNVLHNRALVKAPWQQFRESGNQLFLFYLAVVGISIVLLLVEAGVIVGLVWSDFQTGRMRDWEAYIPALIVAAVFALSWIPIALFFFLYLEMGIPIIYQKRCKPVDAAKLLWSLIKASPGDFCIYCLVRLIMGLLLVTCVFLIGISTCCVGFIFFALPYLGSILTLPYSVFRLGFSLDCLAQFGPEYDLWSRVRPPDLPENLPPL